MATDVEESDTDEHERPAPPKRQCTRLADPNESFDRLSQRLSEPKDVGNEDTEESEYDEVEKLARERLTLWQAYQVAKTFLDNMINHMTENDILNPPVAYPVEDPQFHLFRGTDMEDTGVTMAIRNHGLVNITDTLSQSQTLCASRMSCSAERTCSSVRLPETSDLSALSLPGSSSIFQPSRGGASDRHAAGSSSFRSSSSEDKMDETDREQDFLERAVAEAIKKKGLSALSVDYG